MAKENRGNNKSSQAKLQSAERKAVAQDRVSNKVNVHNGATVSQSGTHKRKR